MADVFNLTPEEEEEMLVEVADKEIDLLKEALKGVHDDGYVIFAPSKPAQQLWGYMATTLPSEFLQYLDPEYLAKMDAGMAPPPVPEVWFLLGPDGKEVLRPHPIPGFQLMVFATQEEAVQWGQIIGLITPEMMAPVMMNGVDLNGNPVVPQLPVESRPNAWSLFLSAGRFENGKEGPIAWEQRDLIRLWNQWGKRTEEAV